jgi:hypothetical protein
MALEGYRRAVREARPARLKAVDLVDRPPRTVEAVLWGD